MKTFDEINKKLQEHEQTIREIAFDDSLIAKATRKAVLSEIRVLKWVLNRD